MEKIFKESKNFFLKSLNTQEKLEKILRDGPGKLHLIADFDMTITKNYVQISSNVTTPNWERNKSAHGMFMYYSKTPPEFIEKTQAIIKKYYPIETSSSIPEQEKIPHMIEWWNRAHELILSLGFTRSDLVEMVRENPLEFRQGTKEMFEMVERKEIPLLVFSAGISDIIECILSENSLGQSSLVSILSNRMSYDQETGKIVKFHDPLMHVFNKDESTLFLQDSFKLHSKLIQSRPNVILIGDSLGDIRMGKGMDHETTLSIGLLNSFKFDEESGEIITFIDEMSKEECLKLKMKYLETFDIVVTGDTGFDEHLNLILSSLK